MAKTKQEWLYQLRRCSSLKTLEKIIAKNQGTLTSDKIETFNSAVDHRLAELTMNKLYDKVPASVWKYVKERQQKEQGIPHLLSFLNKHIQYIPMRRNNLRRNTHEKNIIWEKIAIITASAFIIFAVLWH